jgi:hypothetical protein
MLFEKDGIKFSIPDRPTVRQQLAYISATTGIDSERHLERLWNGAKTLIESWECELFKTDVNLDNVSNPKIAELILWASIQVRSYINGLEEIPKN